MPAAEIEVIAIAGRKARRGKEDIPGLGVSLEGVPPLDRGHRLIDHKYKRIGLARRGSARLGRARLAAARPHACRPVASINMLMAVPDNKLVVPR